MMWRLVSALSLSALAMLPAAAQDKTDPAVFACQALVREDLSNTDAFRQIGARVAGDAVSIDYEVTDLAGFTRHRQRRCRFKLDAAAQRWEFATYSTPELARCFRATQDGLAAMHREGRSTGTTEERRRIAGCDKVYQAAKMANARQLLVASGLIMRRTYPIAAAQTTLRASP
jgi:hypothetical protein